MKISIKYKILLLMMVSVLFFGLVLLFTNNYLVEKVYLENKKKELLQSSKEIEEIIFNEQINLKGSILSQNINFSLLQKEKLDGINIYLASEKYFYFPDYAVYAFGIELSIANNAEILDDSSSIKIKNVNEEEVNNESSSTKKGENVYEVLEETPFVIEGYNYTKAYYSENNYQTFSKASISTELSSESEIISYIDENSFFAKVNDKYLNTSTLSYQTKINFKGEDTLLMTSIPIASITEGISLTNKFIGIIGGLTSVLTFIWSFFIAVKFTNPITQINRITGKMRDLDFTEQISNKGNDEISELSENINMLSNTLDETIKDLNEKNNILKEEINKERKIDCMRKEFISNVSHELKTPIFLVQGYADGLKDKIFSQEKRDFYCNVIIEETEKMDNLVKELLYVSKLDSDKEKLKKEKIEVKKFLYDIGKKYNITFKEKNINFKLECEENLFCFGNKNKLDQVIKNFINNGIEHVDNNKEIILKGYKENDKIIISLYNSGEKLKDDEKEMVWESFYKKDKSRNRDLGGAGLGLYIVKTILEKHNSFYGVSNINNGVEFWFEIEEFKKSEI